MAVLPLLLVAGPATRSALLARPPRADHDDAARQQAHHADRKRGDD